MGIFCDNRPIGPLAKTHCLGQAQGERSQGLYFVAVFLPNGVVVSAAGNRDERLFRVVSKTCATAADLEHLGIQHQSVPSILDWLFLAPQYLCDHLGDTRYICYLERRLGYFGHECPLPFAELPGTIRDNPLAKAGGNFPVFIFAVVPSLCGGSVAGR